mgnify:FL=1
MLWGELMENSRNSTSLWSKEYVITLLVGLITSFGFSMVYTIISAYSIKIGATLSIAGVVSGIFSISALVSRPFSGLVSDRYNKKRLFVVSTLAIAIAFLGYSVSSNISILMFFRIFHGAAFALSGTASIALISELVPKSRLAEGLGYFGVSQMISRIVGPSMGVYIKELFGYNTLFYCIAALHILALLVLLVLPYKFTKQRQQKKTKIALIDLVAIEVLVYAAIGGVFSLGNGVINSFLVLMGAKRAISNISLYFMVNASAVAVARLFAGRQADQSSITSIVNVSLFCAATAALLLSFGYSLAPIIYAAVLMGIGLAGGQVSLQAECIRAVDEKRSGIAVSTFYIGADVGNGIGPMIGGAISNRFNYGAMFLSLGGLLSVTFLVFNIYQRRQLKTS